jgi:hypothetical protein
MGKQTLFAAALLGMTMLPAAAPAQTTSIEGLRMTREEFIKLLEAHGDAVYIVDHGLITFGKFALTLLAIFGVVGVFFFGWDIKKASDDAKQARFETQKTLLELTSAKEQLSQTRNEISDARQELQKHLRQAAESSKRTLGIEKEVTLVRLRLLQLGDIRGAAAVVASTRTDQSSHPTPLARGRRIHVALVSEVEQVGMNNLRRVAAALQKQVAEDLRPIWNVNATVEAYETLDSVPTESWPVIIRSDIELKGIHSVENGKPFSLVQYDKDSDAWSLNASAVLLNMLTNPSANRLFSGPSPNPVDKGKIVQFLVEISAPVRENGYRIDGVLVSDFVTPEFFQASKRKEGQYSHTGSAKEPLKIVTNGFLSWLDRETNEWHQWDWRGAEPSFRNLGKI